MSGFYSTLGFNLTLQKASLQDDNEQQYSISHPRDPLDGLPLHIVGFYDPNHPQKNTLDIRSSGGTSRLSTNATIQEYLNVTEHLYAMVTNVVLRTGYYTTGISNYKYSFSPEYESKYVTLVLKNPKLKRRIEQIQKTIFKEATGKLRFQSAQIRYLQSLL